MNKDQFKSQALKTYERGRLLAATRFLCFVIPIVLISLYTCGEAIIPLCIGLSLSVAVILLKWRGEEFGSAVGPGLWVGAIVFSVPLALHLLEICCKGNLEVLFCALSGALGGAILGIYVGKSKRQNKLRLLSFSILVASLTAALGCASLGIGATFGLLGTLVLVSASTFLIKKSRT